MAEEKFKCKNSAPKGYDINWSLNPPKITFRPCNNYSENPIDIETVYCRVCQTFIKDEVYDEKTDPELKGA